MTSFIRLSGFFCFIFCFSYAFGQIPETISWKGIVVNEATGEPVPNAVIAVYSQISLYSANDLGIFSIPLLATDSVRVLALGFQSATYHVSKVPLNESGMATLNINQVSYTLKEVTVKGYKGILDPLIFPKLLDDTPPIELNLPSYIGSKMSKTPPGERLLMGKPSPLAALASPVSFGYSLFSKNEKSLRNLAKAKNQEKTWSLMDAYASRENIEILSGLKGDELNDFIIYCNLYLKITSFDNGASVAAKIETLLEKFKQEHQNTEQNQNL